MRFARLTQFRFRPLPLLATVLLVVLGVALGNWQLRRASEKLAVQAKVTAGNAAAPLQLDGQPLSAADAAAIELRRVTVRGQFVRDWPVYLDNRPYQGRAGFYLLMPLRIEGSQRHVLVARGWLPRNAADRTRLPPYDTPAGNVTVHGLARSNMGHVLQLGQAAPLRRGAMVQNLQPDQLAAASGLPMQPLILEQTSEDAPASLNMAGPPMALLRDWPAPSLGVAKHQGYAFQWYALALMAFIFFVVTGYRRGKQSS